MWNSIEPTQEFVFSQVPELIRFVYENPLGKVYERYYLVYNVSEIDYQTITSIYLSVITGAKIAFAFDFLPLKQLELCRSGAAIQSFNIIFHLLKSGFS